jgi:uncharacterized protein (DUF849 family)
MAKKRKVIISCACTGAVHTPSMSPYLPITAKQIAEDAIKAVEAGAAIVHLHARNPEDGRPDQSPEAFAPFLREIRAKTNAVVNITTGGSPYMTIDQRIRPAEVFKPEIASLNMGTMNFGLFHMLDKYKEFKYEWEREYLANSTELIAHNTFKDIERILTMGNANGTKFEFECYDTAHLYTLRHFYDRGLVKGPLFIQTVFGIMGGIGIHPDDVSHMKRTADRLFGKEYEWSVIGAGSHQIKIASMSLAMGGHVRVGLEDSLWKGPGELATGSADQVRLIRGIIENMGLEVATPDESREILALKGLTDLPHL